MTKMSEVNSAGTLKKKLHLDTHCIKLFSQGFPAVICIISQQVDLHLRQPLSVPSRTDAYCPVVTVIGSLPWVLLDVSLPVLRNPQSIGTTMIKPLSNS